VYGVPDGTTVTLTPVITRSGTTLARWLGACSASPGVCAVPVNGRTTTTARFTPVQLFAHATDGGGVTPSPPGVPCGSGCWLYPYSQVVTINAGAFENNVFSRWFGPCNLINGPQCTVRLFQSADIQAIFQCTGDVCSIREPLSHPVRVTLSVSGGKRVKWNATPGSGSAPSGICPGTCRFSARRNTMVSVTVSGTTGLAGWGGPCRGTAHACTFQATPYGSGISVSAR
jgi:hypothetical protein